MWFLVTKLSLAAPFSVDISENTVRIGSGSTNNGILSIYSSDNDTGSLLYNTNDQFQFSGGDVKIDQNLVVDGTINTSTLSGTLLTFSGANPVISPSTLNTGLTLQANGAGTLTLGETTGVNVIEGKNFSVDANGTISARTTVDTINGLIVNAGALSGVTGINTSGSYTQTGTGANTFSGSSLFSASGTGLEVTNNATIGGTLAVGGAPSARENHCPRPPRRLTRVT